MQKNSRARRRHPEAAAAISESFPALAAAISDPLILLDASGQIIAANQPAWTELEATPGSAVPVRLSDLTTQPEELGAFLRAAAAGPQAARPIAFRSSSRRPRANWCEARAVEMPGAGGPLVLLHCRPIGDAQLELALREKEAQLREQRHRGRNNLQVLLSMFGLAIRDERDEHTRARLLDMRNRVLAMSLVQRLVRQQGGHAVVDAATLVSDLSRELRQARGVHDAALAVEVESLSVSVEAAGPLAFILGELLAEALGRAAAAAQVRVGVALRRAADGTIELTVVDDARPVRQPADPRISAGPNLARGLAGQLGGTLTLEEDGGTRWRLRFADPDLPDAQAAAAQ